jgi:hypothetical protein
MIIINWRLSTWMWHLVVTLLPWRWNFLRDMNSSGDKTFLNGVLVALFRCKVVDIFIPRVLEVVCYFIGPKHPPPPQREHKLLWKTIRLLSYDTDPTENDASHNSRIVARVFVAVALATIKGSTHTDTQTDGRDLWSAPLIWAHLPWYKFHKEWFRHSEVDRGHLLLLLFAGWDWVPRYLLKSLGIKVPGTAATLAYCTNPKW